MSPISSYSVVVATVLLLTWSATGFVPCVDGGQHRSKQTHDKFRIEFIIVRAVYSLVSRSYCMWSIVCTWVLPRRDTWHGLRVNVLLLRLPVVAASWCLSVVVYRRTVQVFDGVMVALAVLVRSIVDVNIKTVYISY